jgi:uncharacterized protein
MKIAIVTGASSGIGKEMVEIILGERPELDQIWVIARREERLIELRDTLGDKIVPLVYDMAQEREFTSLVKRLRQHRAKVWMLVNSAGYGKFGDFEVLPLETQTGMVDLNCTALTALTYQILPFMGRGSKIVNIASSAGFAPQAHFAVYSATKSYVLNFSRALNQELKERKISVTAVCPGPVKTEFFDVAQSDTDGGMIRHLTKADPIKVAKKAYDDALSRKEVSVYGKLIKAFLVVSKILPHQWLLRLIG